MKNSIKSQLLVVAEGKEWKWKTSSFAVYDLHIDMTYTVYTTANVYLNYYKLGNVMIGTLFVCLLKNWDLEALADML